jgi:NAD(P)H-dependent FMN reductase
MKIAIINGSHRENAQSAKVAAFIDEMLREKGLCDETWRFDLTGNPLPLWDESIWEGDEEWVQRLQPISEQLASSDGFVVISPEWHGMVPAGLKNFFLMWGRGELAHKPALIVTVSSGIGGAYPVNELRQSSYKNNRICYIPEHLIIRNVESVLNQDGENDPEADTYFRERTEFALKILREYAVSLKSVRDSGLTFDERFKNGM